MNNSKAHQELLDDVWFAVGELIGERGRIFPRRVGVAVPIGRTKPVRYGINGEADLQGWIRVHREVWIAMAFAIEIKTGKGDLTIDQKNWKHVFEQCGGVYIEGRSVNQVLTDVKRLLL